MRIRLLESWIEEPMLEQEDKRAINAYLTPMVADLQNKLEKYCGQDEQDRMSDNDKAAMDLMCLLACWREQLAVEGKRGRGNACRIQKD